MPARTLDGTAAADAIYDSTAIAALEFARRSGRAPLLATVLVGEDPSSQTYVRMKRTRCRRVGIDSRAVELPASTTTAELVAEITRLSLDPAVDGILLQHPVPAHVDERAAFEAIAPAKDVDGVTMASYAAMAFGEPGFHSCTPGGILRLLDVNGIDLAGKHAVVVGRSPILGKPVSALLLARDATVTTCHSRTTDLADQVARADLVVAAVGKPELVRGEWIKPGAVVVDAGYHPGGVGDVDQAGAAERASWLTPVPGGVGPMTIALLLEQTVAAARRHTRAAA
ncbi:MULTISPECIES: tetrahydrofolate dehydrogenase/cyclohydrolase catalytic domain-containing protein [Actinosynnema]|uniref:bifunctional 5,10-methylenetetrahydrofolate dehydrogenase/5,10-methenyltetrahydrofolate cyclohydrolase n=1 Tax=Actinosynnema TaxID=40566 RepID=UPI0020A616B7|nr:methylenetetrahydrofolate dehydrogenase (NADP+) / methenyltetrahydrofolate cyclohydrolase [Actinosynnema pretiosum]